MTEITRESWARALVECWLKESTLGCALIIASGITPYHDNKDDPPFDWNEACRQAGLPEFTRLKQKAAPWIATNYRNANMALWDGKLDLARKWIQSGKDKPAYKKMRPSIEAKQNIPDAPKNRLMVSLRERDTRRNWNVCK